MVLLSGAEALTEIWHAPDCADHLEWMRQIEVAAEEVRQEDEWAAEAFPAGYARMQEALRALPDQQRQGPFVAALTELVELQAARQAAGGGFVILP